MRQLGWASTNEDIWEVVRQALDPVPAEAPPRPRFTCPICFRGFETGSELGDHISTVHAQHRPRLLIHGREPSTIGEVIRAPVAAKQVHLLYVTAAHATVDGRPVDGEISAQLPTLLAGLREERVRICLENAADPSRIRPEMTIYDLDFRVVNKNALNRVDAAFRDAILVGGDPLTLSSVTRFVEAARMAGSAATDYAAALASYLNGVLIKDQAPGTGVLPPQAEYEAKYKEAIAGLSGIHRPLATMVAGLARFALNDFSSEPIASGFARLDRVAYRLARLAGQNWPDVLRAPNQVRNHGGRICPTDTGTDTILTAAEEIAALPRWGRPAANGLYARINGTDWFRADRVKITALSAEAALRFGADTDATNLLRRLIRESAIFNEWAEAEMARLMS